MGAGFWSIILEPPTSNPVELLVYPYKHYDIPLKGGWLHTSDVLWLVRKFWIWVFSPKIVVPQNGWFIMEIPIKMDGLGVPLFSETPICWKISLFLPPQPSGYYALHPRYCCYSTLKHFPCKFWRNRVLHVSSVHVSSFLVGLERLEKGKCVCVL